MQPSDNPQSGSSFSPPLFCSAIKWCGKRRTSAAADKTNGHVEAGQLKELLQEAQRCDRQLATRLTPMNQEQVERTFAMEGRVRSAVRLLSPDRSTWRWRSRPWSKRGRSGRSPAANGSRRLAGEASTSKGNRSQSLCAVRRSTAAGGRRHHQLTRGAGRQAPFWQCGSQWH